MGSPETNGDGCLWVENGERSTVRSDCENMSVTFSPHVEYFSSQLRLLHNKNTC